MIMGDGYTKLFSDIVDSSIWDENADTRVVWVTLLALANADGLVRGSVGWLAGKARVSVKACETALRLFESPDPKSRTPDNDGRRIETLEDGWLILNYLIFRDRLSTNPIAVKTRERVRKHRERYIALRNVTSVTRDHSASASASESVPVRTKPEKIKKPVPVFKKPDQAMLEGYATKILLPVTEINKFYDYYEANGWKVGRNPMKDWQAAMRNWKRNMRAPATNKNDFWQNTKELDLVQKELDAIRARASHVAGEVQIEPRDRAAWERLKTRKAELKTKLGLK